MLVDAQQLFSDAQAITATAASTNLIDLGIARSLGTGERLYLVCLVDTAFTDAGSDSTVVVTIETDTAEGFGSATTVQTIGTFLALAAAGTMLIVPVAKFATDERYVRLMYTVANGNLTTGAITSFLTHDVQDVVDYASGYTIS